MQGYKKFWSMALGLILALALIVPAWPRKRGSGQRTMGALFKKERAKLCGELKLSPDKAKEFMAIGDKYDQQRQEIIEQIKKNEGELKAAVAASPPDEAKIKGLVDDAVANQEKLLRHLQGSAQGRDGAPDPDAAGQVPPHPDEVAPDDV